MHRIFDGGVFRGRNSRNAARVEESENRKHPPLLDAFRKEPYVDTKSNKRKRKAAIWIFAGAALLSAVTYSIFQEVNEGPQRSQTEATSKAPTTTTIKKQVHTTPTTTIQPPYTTTTQPHHTTTTSMSIPTTIRKKASSDNFNYDNSNNYNDNPSNYDFNNYNFNNYDHNKYDNYHNDEYYCASNN